MMLGYLYTYSFNPLTDLQEKCYHSRFTDERSEVSDLNRTLQTSKDSRWDLNPGL